jgi:hypothetical protein
MRPASCDWQSRWDGKVGGSAKNMKDLVNQHWFKSISNNRSNTMKKKSSLSLILALVMVLSVSMTAVAQGGFGLTTEITPTSTSADPIIVEQGQTILLTATTTSSTGSVNFVSESWTNASVVTPASGSGTLFVSTANFSSNVLGSHTVYYTIRVSRGAGAGIVNEDSGDTAYLEVVEEINGEIEVYVAPMAAPAVAAKILQYNGVSARYGSGPNGGNFIADVALFMGPQTLFNGVPKEIWSEYHEAYVSNPAYWEEVLDFLNEHPRMNVTLESAYDWFVGTLE